MGLEVVFEWWLVGWFTAGLVALGCLAWLLKAAPRSALRDGFALFLVVQSGTLLLPIQWTEGGTHYLLGEVADIAMVFPPFLILATWLAAERGARRPRWLPWATMALILATPFVWWAVPAWRTPFDDSHQGAGWLFTVTETFEIACYVALSTLFMRAAVRRDSIALAMAGAGFAAWPLLLGLGTIAALATHTWKADPAAFQPHLILVNHIVLAGATLYTLGAAAYIVARGERNRTRRALAAVVFGSAAIGALFVALRVASGQGRDGPWALALTIAAGLSSILLYIFGTLLVVAEGNVANEPRVWRTVRRGALPATMVATFFVVSETAQGFLSGHLGPLVGVVATVPLVLLLTPLQRLGERLGRAIAPRAADQVLDQREALFERQVRYAWVDGRIGAAERARLLDLRRDLGIAAERAEAIEEAIVARAARPSS